MTADGESPDLSGLPTLSAPSAAQATPAAGVADTRLEALEAQVRALVTSQTALLSAQQNTGQGISRAGRTGASAPPLSEAGAGRAGFSLEQLTALLGAAGRPPERLRDGRLATLPGASSSSHLPLQNRPVTQAAASQPASLPRARAPPSTQQTGATTPVAGELDAASLLAALAQQSNNLLGALAKNRGDSFGDYLDTEERPTTGVRGYQARQQFQASLKRDPDTVYSAVRRRLAEAIETDEALHPCREPRCALSSRTKCSAVGFHAGPHLFRVRHRTALGGGGAGRFGRAHGSGSSPSSLPGTGGRGRWSASAGLALDRDAESSVPVGAGPFAEGPGGPRRVPWRPALGRGEPRLPQGRGLFRGSRKACGRQAADCGPAWGSGTHAKGKVKGSSEGSGQGHCRGRRGRSVEAGEPGACAAVLDPQGAFRARLSHGAAAHVPGPRGSAAVAAEPPPFSADADAPLFRFLLTPTQKSDQRVNEFDAITLALSLRRRILGARCGLAEFCRSSMAQLTAEPSPGLGRDPWPLPPPDPLVDRGARSSRSRPRWRKAAAVREFVRFGVMALSWQTLRHPIACPLACRVGVPRTFEQTRHVERSHVVAGALVRLGFGPSCDLGRSLDKFRTVGDDLATLSSQVHSFAEASTGSAHFPASYKFGSGPIPEPAQPSQARSSSAPKVGIHKGLIRFESWDLGPSFDPPPYLDDGKLTLTPRSFGFPRTSGPPLPRAKVHASASEYLKLLQKWDAVGAPSLLLENSIDASERCGMFPVYKDEDFDRFILNPTAVNSRMRSITRHTVDFRNFIVFFGLRPWHIEIRHRVKKTYTINFFGFEILKLKIRRLELWKPTVRNP